MIRVAHRGNISGRNSSTENDPEHIIKVLESDTCHVEVDVWMILGEYYLGHDEPTYRVSECFLEEERIICHAKNLDGLYAMLKNGNIHCFWHEADKVAITSKKWVWKYPEIYGPDGSLIGICLDNVEIDLGNLSAE